MWQVVINNNMMPLVDSSKNLLVKLLVKMIQNYCVYRSATHLKLPFRSPNAISLTWGSLRLPMLPKERNTTDDAG